MTLIDGNKQTKKVLIDISVMSLPCNTEKSTIQGEAWMTKTSFCSYIITHIRGFSIASISSGEASRNQWINKAKPENDFVLTSQNPPGRSTLVTFGTSKLDKSLLFQHTFTYHCLDICETAQSSHIS